MLFAVDIGNSNVVIGVMRRGELVYSLRLVSDIFRTKDEYAAAAFDFLRTNAVARGGIDGAIISSVVPPLTPVFRGVCREVLGIEAVVVDSSVKTGINLAVDNPGKVGADLVCAAAAAAEGYALPAIIVDMGTATTITAVDKNKNYIGGAFFPGLALSYNALSEAAALLPGISLEPPKKAIARGTSEAMRSGAIFGTAALIDGMLARFESELGACGALLATGGLAGVVAPHCKHRLALRPNLIFDGLYLIYERSWSRKETYP
jgi:type III pantothenate kinase